MKTDTIAPSAEVDQSLQYTLRQIARYLATDGPEGVLMHDIWPAGFAIYDRGRDVTLTSKERLQGDLGRLQACGLRIENLRVEDAGAEQTDGEPSPRFEHVVHSPDSKVVQAVLYMRVAGIVAEPLTHEQYGTLKAGAEVDMAVVVYVTCLRGSNQLQVLSAVADYDLPALFAPEENTTEAVAKG